MKSEIKKSLVKKVAWEILSKDGKCTNIDVVERLEHEIGRPLTPGEKRRVTRYLQSHYNIERVQRNSARTPYPLTITVYR